MKDVENAPEVVKRLRRLFVLHGEHEIEERLVVHLAFERLQLLKDAIDEDCGETWRVACQLSLVEHAILVLIKL